jgi:thioesterase domain-containing protein
VKMQEATGIKIPLSVLFSAPTVWQLAAYLRSAPGSHDSHGLAAIQPLGSERPFFMAEARSMFYRFAQLLGPNQPFLGMPWPDLPELEKPYDIRQIAALLVKRILSKQPHGPYVVGGWCVASTVAYEIAQQLTERGETVELLLFFDGANISRDGSRSKIARWKETAQFFVSSTIFNLKSIRGMGAREGAAFACARTATVLKRADLLFWRAVSKLLMLRGRALGEPGNLKDIERAIMLAAFDYQPKPYAGRVVYFKRGVLPELSGNAATFWWGSLLARGLEMYETGGRHSEMFQSPNVEALAAKVRELLADARGGQAAEDVEEHAQAAIS